MERINPEEFKPQEHREIEQPSKRLLAKWITVVEQIAHDKHYDLTPEALQFWTHKLHGIADDEICDALLLGRWKFFPSVDDVLEQIDKIANENRQRAQSSQRKFISCGKCEEGWVPVFIGHTAGGNMVDQKFGAMKRCKCFTQWALLRKAA